MTRGLLSILFSLIAIGSALSQQKNVIFFIVDDLKPMLGAFDQNQIHSPNIDQLAAQSAVFTNAHTQQAVCGPSRISLLTGMRPDHTKVYDLHTFMRSMNPDILTIPQHFKNNGYETAGMGKVFHMAKKDDPQSWTLPFTNEKQLPYSQETGPPVLKYYQSLAIKELVQQANEEDIHLDRDDLQKKSIYPSSESLDLPDDAYADGAMAVKSIELLNLFSKQEKSFFLTVGFNKPHLPFNAPKKYWDLYDRSSIAIAPFQKRAENTKSFAYHTSGELRNYSDIPANLNVSNPLSEEKQRELIHAYYACISYVDAQIGKILDELKRLNLYENTVVVLVGDHGWHLGDHGLWNKHTNFEQATRTPLIVHAAGMKQALINNSPVELVDVFPTVSELAGLEIPSFLHGTSLVDVVSGTSSTAKDVAVSQYPKRNLMGYSARSDRYRYTEWHKKGPVMEGKYVSKKVKARELYDYEKDPLETKNLIDDPAYKEVIIKMRGNLKAVLAKE